MTKKLSALLVLVSVLAIFALTASARVMPPDPRLERISDMYRHLVPQLADDAHPTGTNLAARPARLSGALAGPASRGALVAQTWRDWHANAGINRTVAVTEPQSSFGVGVQFAYMAKASAATGDRNKWGWNAYDGVAGAFVKPGGSVIVQDPTPSGVEAGSYPKVFTNPSNGQGVVGSYDFTDALNNSGYQQMHMSWEALPFSGNFGIISDGSVMPDSIDQKNNIGGLGDYCIWPATAMTYTASDTVMYEFGFEGVGGANANGSVKVFRRDMPLGFNGTTFAYPDAGWTLVFTDTSFFPTCDFAASRVSTQVAATWLKWSPTTPLSGTNLDVYYANSPTGLAGTWTRTNLTHYSGNTFRAYLEAQALYDSSDKLHIIWTAGQTTDGGATRISNMCRLFHWSEWNPGTIYTMYNAAFTPSIKCLAGGNVLNVGRISFGECNGKLYGTFTDWNDPTLNDSTDDCAKSSDPSYGANGEIWLVVSKDLQGKSWDKPRDLSNNMTPGCDTTSVITGGGNCGDDVFSCVSSHGIDDALYTGSKNWAPSGATYDPSGSYTGTAYTEVFYVTDRFPGGAVFTGQGPYTLNDMRWIRLACVDPITSASLAVTPSFINFPAYSKHGVEKDTTLVLENDGNTTLTFSPGITSSEDSCKGVGCAGGWLGISAPPGSIAEASNTSMTLKLNMGGVSNNATGPTRFWGHLQMNYGPPSQIDTFHISFTVADSIAATVWDTIATSTNIKLAVGSNGDMGLNFEGGANLNFNPPVECDNDSATSGPHFSRGFAKTYLGDGSPVILRKPGTTANLVASWSIFSQGYTQPEGFKPLPPQAPYNGKPWAFKDTTLYQRFFSGTFTTVDSLLRIEKTWYAPKTSPDTNNFMVEKLQIFPTTPGAKVDSLYIGEAFDWDIPTDSGTANNYGNFDATRRLVYLEGFESSDTISTKGYDCANNSMRYGGSALIAQGLDSLHMSDTLWGGYTAANDSFVYPANGFVPVQLYTNMRAPGYSKETRITDQHIVLTYKASNVNPPTPATGWTLPATVHDTLTVWSIMAVTRVSALPTAPGLDTRTRDQTAANIEVNTHGLDSLKLYIDKGKKWANFWLRGLKSCCVGKRGNVNCTGAIDLGDLSALVSYLTGGGFVLCCFDGANVNGTGAIDLGDLSALVSYLTGGGFVLVNCP